MHAEGILLLVLSKINGMSKLLKANTCLIAFLIRNGLFNWNINYKIDHSWKMAININHEESKSIK